MPSWYYYQAMSRCRTHATLIEQNRRVPTGRARHLPEVSPMTQPSNQAPGSITTNNISGAGIAIGHGAQAMVTIYQTIARHAPSVYRAALEKIAEEYGRVFGGREPELAALNRWLDDERAPACALLVAPTGRGKTALLVHWVAQLAAQTAWHVIFVPISRRFEVAQQTIVLDYLARRLAAIHKDEQTLAAYDLTSPDNLRGIVADYLRRPLPEGARLLVALDGIDEAVGWEIGRTLLPATPPSGMRILVAAREVSDRSWHGWCNHLGWNVASAWQVPLGLLNRAAVQRILAAMGNPLDALAQNIDWVAQLERISAGDPLTIRFVVEGLQRGEITPERLARMPPGLQAYVEDWVNTLVDRSANNVVIAAVLNYCAAACAPLTAEDLYQLDPTTFSKTGSLHQALRDRELARFLIRVPMATDAGGKEGYVFSHQRLREVFWETDTILSAQARQAIQQAFVAYGERWYADRSRPLPAYLRRFWIAHLQAAGAWDRMRQVLTEIVPSGEQYIQPWQAARHAAEGSDTGYLSDLDTLWTHAETTGDLALALRCALIAASLRSRNGNLLPELLVQLVQVGTPEGRWSAAAALETIAHMPDEERQAACLAALVNAGIELPWPRALEIAQAITAADARARALTTLVPHLPPEQQPEVYTQALAAAQAITDHDARARALAALAPRLAATPATDNDFLPTLRVLARRGRPALLDDLAALAPWLATLAARRGQPAAPAALAEAIVEMGRCWS